ncbi:glycosyltransferase family 39 protein, partial [Candidatus Microgenomates bacterium]|nr:glycosyltransferase family 39 protein [Candidatus Microgenomates bacterium]
SLLSIYSIYRVWQKKEYKWLWILGVAFAFVLNSHYLGLVLLPVLGLIWLISFIQENKNKKQLIINSLIGLFIFLFLMSPLVIFDIRHGGNNFKAIKGFFTMRETTVSIKPWKAIPAMWPQYQEYTTRLLGGRNELAGKVIAFGVFDLLILALIKSKGKILKDFRYQLVLLWLLTATVGLGLYKQHIYDHYYGFFFAAPFLLIGAMYQDIWQKKRKIVNILMGLGFIAILFVNFLENPLKNPPNMQMQRAENVSREIIKLSNGEKINFALIAESNYDSGYRYFLDLFGAKIIDIDPQHADTTIQQKLFVVCENLPEKCDPTHNAKAEVAGFGWSKIENQWSIYGVTIFELGHAK